MGISAAHRGSNKICSAIKSAYFVRIPMRIADKDNDMIRQARKSCLGAEGLSVWYSAIYLDKAVLRPETVIEKQIVEIGKIS